MGKLIGIALIAGAVAMAMVVGQRMSTDAMAVVVGVAFGVAASIPTSLLVVAATTRSRRDEGYRAPRDELRPPPQVIVVQPQQLPPAPQIVAPLQMRRWGELAAADEEAVWTMVGEE